MLKSSVKNVLDRFGYDIQKKTLDDIDLYLEIYDKSDVEGRRFYNVGAGLFKHPAWTNVDYYSDWYEHNKIDINFNLLTCEKLPIPDNSANIVYSSHTIEHINDAAAQNLFNEAYRILKTKGFLRLTTPNIDLYYKALQNNDMNFWKWEIDTYSIKENMKRGHIGIPMNSVSLKQIFLFSFASQLSTLHIDATTKKISDDAFDEIFANNPYEDALGMVISKCDISLQAKYPGNHVNWWNSSKLLRMLQKAGFNDIYTSGYAQSMSAVLRNTTYFDNTHPNRSIYIEARK